MSVQTTKAIKSIRFSVWSPTEIRKYSVAEITVPETYDEDGIPVQGGLMDGRLGTLEPGQKCLTCGNMAARCPGHFGHLELAEPILHIAFIDNIHKLLLISCRSCSRLKVTQTDLEEFSNIQKREAAYTVLSQKHIPEKILEMQKKFVYVIDECNVQYRFCKLQMSKVSRTSCSHVSTCKASGSSVPSRPSIRPPCTGIPSSSYVSGTVISATEYFRISVGDHTEKRIDLIAFVVCTDI